MIKNAWNIADSSKQIGFDLIFLLYNIHTWLNFILLYDIAGGGRVNFISSNIEHWSSILNTRGVSVGTPLLEKWKFLRNFKFSFYKVCLSTGIKIIFQILLNDSMLSAQVNLMPVLQQILSDKNLKFLREKQNLEEGASSGWLK